MIAQGAEAKVYYHDGDGLMRIVLTQPYVNCERLATKEEIDEMVMAKVDQGTVPRSARPCGHND
jgi:hypothetical protein